MVELSKVVGPCAQIAVAAVTLATAGGAGAAGVAVTAVGPFVVPLATLTAIGIDHRLKARAVCAERATASAIQALRNVPDFARARGERIEALLQDGGPVTLDRSALGEVAWGGPDDFDRRFRNALAAVLIATINFQPGDHLERRVVAFDAALACLLRDDEMRGAIDRNLLLLIAEEVRKGRGDLSAKIDHIDAGQQAILSLLKQTDEYRLMREAGITEEAIIKLARGADAKVTNLDAAWAYLRDLVASALRIQAEGQAGSNLGDFVARVLADVAALAREGRTDEAAESIDHALAQEEAESRDRRLRLLASGIEVDRQRLDPTSAARRVMQAVDLTADSEADYPAARFARLWAQQNEWYAGGRDRGLSFDLKVAIALAREGLSRARTDKERGMAGNDLGVALKALGEREAGTAYLDEAVTVLLTALMVRTPEQVPLQWSATQGNLGDALRVLGEREVGTARLEEAVAVLRAVLIVLTREQMPLEWAMTQCKLADALRALGHRETGTARLEEAVAAYRAALTVRTRERMPVEWAMTQNNIGTTLQALATHEPGTARLEEAVAAYRAALTVRTRDQQPFAWAMTQSNLGTSLAILGEREAGTTRLDEAVAAFHAVLTVWTQHWVPIQWAVTQNNRARAEVSIFEKTSDSVHLDVAEGLAQTARAVFAAAGAGRYLSMA